MIEERKVIAIGSDHAGFALKKELISFLKDQNFVVEDYGTDTEESVDYPDIIHPLANAINCNKYQRGIIICGSGIGVSITANKYRNVRAALCWNEELATLARLHNDANIISIGARFIDIELAKKIIITFLTTCFEGGRHSRRVEKISQV